MLITPYTYRQLQRVEQDTKDAGDHQYQPAVGWRTSPQDLRRGHEMLLVHQSGSVKIGEVVRYTLTYTPSLDRILPSPSQLHVRIKNTSAIALRAAYLHGPYTLYASAYPATFNPNSKHETSEEDGTPNFEPNLKAGGSWLSQLVVPKKIRETAGKANVKRTTDGKVPSCTWIIEVSSQVLFSTTAAVDFEVLVGRDEKSVELGFSALTGHAAPTPGQLQDHQQGRRNQGRRGAAQPKGVFSKAVHLVVDDTASLWNKPALPEWNDEGKHRGEKQDAASQGESEAPLSKQERSQNETGGAQLRKEQTTKKRKIHLVILTHGLHSNLGADMLYLKESIDATAKEAREAARQRKESHRAANSRRSQEEQAKSTSSSAHQETSTAPLSGGQDDLDTEEQDSNEDEEEVIVRGFAGNAVRTEKGIQYLGKRLAKYVLSMTYPDQPFLPVKKSMAKSLSRAFTGSQGVDAQAGPPSHKDSSIHRSTDRSSHLAYKITSISFIAHSLGGLTQTYAIAYIHKHSPHFFEEIKPINFVTMASPFLGLSNENPMYVKFALDFGLVGRTGQDLGLTWRAPTMVRSGWGAMIGGIGSEGQRAQKQPDPGSKPLLRVLPMGPAHQVLKLFRNRTVYSNVVNDGIVPLRTSCLLFLDWSGLGRVEKARRENGLIGTMAGWGWAEMTGQNSSQRRQLGLDSGSGAESGEESSRSTSRDRRHQATVPQPSEDATRHDTTAEEQTNPEDHQFIDGKARPFQDEDYDASKSQESSPAQPQHPFSSFLNFLRPNQTKSHHHSPKNTKIYKRGQTIRSDQSDGTASDSSPPPPPSRPGMARGESLLDDPNNSFAPPKTTFFESAGDILNPPLPSTDFLLDPASRPRTIFHDRVYHPEDIPPPPDKKRATLKRSFSSDASRKGMTRSNTDYGDQSSSGPDTSGMKVEEKIARAYHRDLSWRKVLVRLEPDAHNNICVRRMFSNAYGWPVVKHLVDTHFSSGFEARTADEKEHNSERAKPPQEPVGEHGEELRERPTGDRSLIRSDSEIIEAKDDVSEMRSLHNKNSSLSNSHTSGGRQKLNRQDSAMWDDAMFDVTDDDDDDIDTARAMRKHREARERNKKEEQRQTGTTEAEIADFLSAEPPEEPEGLDLPKRPDPIPTTASSSNPEFAVTPATPRQLQPPKETSSPGGTTTVGLGKSVQEQMSSPGSRRNDDDEEDSRGILTDMTRMSMGRE